MDSLRKDILKKTWEHKIPDGKNVFRTFYVPISEEIEVIKSWYVNWFPLKDQSLDSIYKWLPIVESPEEQKKSLLLLWAKTLGADTLNEILNKGFLLPDQTVQIIFLVDLSKKNAFSRLSSTKKIFDEIIAESNTNVPIFFTCIAILRNFDKETSQFSAPLNIQEFFNWTRGNLHRLFAVDIHNQGGTLISSESDMLFFLGQLLYYISQKPVEGSLEEGIQNFAEWMGRVDPNKDQASAFSATSYVFPIDYVLDVCLVHKGTLQIEKALFSEPDNQKVNFYLNSIINKNGLNSHNVFREYVFSERVKKPGETPSDYVSKILKSNNVKSTIEGIELHVLTYKTIDALIPEMAERISKVYSDQVSNVSLSFYYSLFDHIDKIFNEESGSVHILQRTFDNLYSHLSKFNPEQNESQSPGDLDNLLENLEKEKNKAPTGKGVISRAVILLVLSFVTVLEFFQSGNLVFLALTTSTLLITISYLAYNWFASKRRIEKIYLQIEDFLDKKWLALKTEVQNEFIEIIRKKSLMHLKDIQSQTEKVAKRFKKIIEFGKNGYDPPKPVGSAFWMNAINTKEEALSFADYITEPAITRPLGVFKKQGSAELWSRLGFSAGEELNDWEKSLLEKAAIDLIPNAEKLLNISVCDFLETHPDKLETLKNILARYCEPFTAINKLHTRNLEGILETPATICEIIADSLYNKISNNFTRMNKKNSGSRYRVSFLSFTEGLNFEWILETLKRQS